MQLSTFSSLRTPTRRLLLARAFRSVGQGALVVDFALYLKALHWSGETIGLVLSASGLFGAGLSLLIGIGSDRIRRRPFLLVYESIALVGSLIAVATAQPVVLSVVAVLGAFGRGANGAAGPFSPAEQAWLAEAVDPRRRGAVYSLNSAIGFFGMAIGAAAAALPTVWRSLLPGAESYRPLFVIVTLSSIANLWLLARTEERYEGTGGAAKAVRGDEIAAAAVMHEEAAVRRRENGVLARLVAINSFNGVAIGLVGPLISYWFALRFGVGPSLIGPTFALTFVVTGIAAIITGNVATRVGVVRSVVWARLAGLILLAVLPVLPVFWLAAAVYLVRSALNRGTAGARQALAIGLVRDSRRGLASSLNTVSMQFPQSAGPTIAGLLIDAGFLAFPFYAAAVLQGAYLLLYTRYFRRYDVPRGKASRSLGSRKPDESMDRDKGPPL